MKLIDEFPGQPPTRSPGDALDPEYPSGRQQLVRAGVMRGRFRDDFSKPIPMKSGEIVEIEVPLRDVLHTFKRGHRIMIQVQSTWFPFIDRNPQTWVENIFEAEESDFRPQIHRIFHSEQFPSEIRFQQLK